MQKDTEKTIVVFRKFRDGEVIALFPELPDDVYGHYCVSYMHVGQHGAASPHGYGALLKSAKPDEYAPLARELESIGYNLEIRQRITAKMDERRRIAASMMSGAA